MKTTIDLTEDGDAGQRFEVSDPSSIQNEDLDVVIQLREVEIRMSFPQFVTFAEAVDRHLFCCSRPNGWSVDINDPDHCPEREHHELRVVLRNLLDDALTASDHRGKKIEVPEEVRFAIQSELLRRRIAPEEWVTLKGALSACNKKIEQLEEQIRALKNRRASKVAT